MAKPLCLRGSGRVKDAYDSGGLRLASLLERTNVWNSVQSCGTIPVVVQRVKMNPNKSNNNNTRSLGRSNTQYANTHEGKGEKTDERSKRKYSSRESKEATISESLRQGVPAWLSQRGAILGLGGFLDMDKGVEEGLNNDSQKMEAVGAHAIDKGLAWRRSEAGQGSKCLRSRKTGLEQVLVQEDRVSKTKHSL